MVKFFLGIFLAASTSVFAFQSNPEGFVYDDHGKRDPFGALVTSTGAVVAYDSDLSVADLSLEGMLSDPQGNSAAIINGKIVKVSDKIGPYEVESIGADHVDLLKDGQQFLLKLKKGGPN